jgi:hypothetical protein
MFKKLISNLPFNPSLLHQVSFYTKRIKQEESLRRLGFGFVALAMLIQIYAVAAPPQKSLANSNDYIINGLQTRDDILRAWDGQTSDAHVAEIYGKFGVTRDDIARLPATPNVTIASTGADYWTTGRQSLGAVSKAGSIKAGYKNSEIPINTGSTTIYVRNLKAWDIVNSTNYYRAFQGTMANGQTFWILQDCGNFTTIGVPPTSTPAPNPGLEFRKTIDGGAQTLKPGDQFSFRFEYRNNVPGSTPATNANINDVFDLANFDIVSWTVPFAMSGANGNLALGNVGYTDYLQTASVVTVKLKGNLANGVSTCNAAKLTADNATEAWGGGAPSTCVNVVNPCPLDTSILTTDSRCTTPVAACTLTNTDVNRTTKEATLKTVFTTSNPALTTVVSYVYDFGDNSTGKTNTSAALTDTVTHVYKDGTYTATVNVNYKIGNGSGQQSKVQTCSGKVESKPDQPLGQEKSAKNITQNLDDATTLKTKANGGDVIEYSLIMHNSYDYARANVNVADTIQDVLDYADIDQAFLKSQGGTFDSKTSTVSFPAFAIPATGSVTKKFRVTIKSPIPSTNQPGAMSTNFDCNISNKFGNQIDVPINCPPAKTAEYVATTLPNTGPGSSLLIGFIATVVIAYFFARSRLLGKELDLVRTEYASGGSY